MILDIESTKEFTQHSPHEGKIIFEWSHMKREKKTAGLPRLMTGVFHIRAIKGCSTRKAARTKKGGFSPWEKLNRGGRHAPSALSGHREKGRSVIYFLIMPGFRIPLEKIKKPNKHSLFRTKGSSIRITLESRRTYPYLYGVVFEKGFRSSARTNGVFSPRNGRLQSTRKRAEPPRQYGGARSLSPPSKGRLLALEEGLRGKNTDL